MSFNPTEFEKKVRDHLGKNLPVFVVFLQEESCVLSVMPLTSTFGFPAFEIHWWNQKFCVKECPDGDLTLIEGDVYKFIVNKTTKACF